MRSGVSPIGIRRAASRTTHSQIECLMVRIRAFVAVAVSMAVIERVFLRNSRIILRKVKFNALLVVAMTT